MSRTRSWSMDKPNFRYPYTRLSQPKGNFSTAIDNLLWPVTNFEKNVAIINSPYDMTWTLSGINTPLRLKIGISSGTKPRDIIVVYKFIRNGFTFYGGVGTGSYSSHTFQNGDVLSLGIDVVGGSNEGSFSFYLINNKDETQCSNIFTYRTYLELP